MKNPSAVLLILFALLIPDKTRSTQKQKIKSVLILGNSITHHKSKPDIGWNGDWGMAASAQEKDFVHILKAKMEEYNPTLQFAFGTIAIPFERRFWKMDTLAMAPYKSANPDLLVLKIGENIEDSLANRNELNVYLKRLVTFICPKNQTEVLLVGSFWPNKNVDSIFEKTSEENRWKYIDLKGLYEKRYVNTAVNFFSNPKVARHPSDKGMQNIAERIWTVAQPLF